MKSMMQRTLAGPFLAQDLGNGHWQLTAGAPKTLQVFLKVPGDGACAALRNNSIQSLALEWRNDGVTVRVTAETRSVALEAATAIIHQAQNGLYDRLPLASFDTGARQFWKRVFLLLRVPGGRFLLRLIARRPRLKPRFRPD